MSLFLQKNEMAVKFASRERHKSQYLLHINGDGKEEEKQD